MAYLRARYYDQATGRFLGQDPLPFLQRYVYVGNNPANFVDPAGACTVEVRAKKIDLPGAAWLTPHFHHLYIVTKDPITGEAFGFRVGPSKTKFSGSFEKQIVPWAEGFKDWDPKSKHHVEVVERNDKESCAQFNSIFRDVAAELDGHVPYGFVKRNSNSFVRALLVCAELPERQPIEEQKRVPGWGNRLRQQTEC